MARPRFSFGLVLAILASACMPSLTPAQQAAANKIKISKSDPPNGCEDVGSVSGGSMMADQDQMKEQMRTLAFSKGANYIRLDGMQEAYSVGTAFKCPEAPAVE